MSKIVKIIDILSFALLAATIVLVPFFLDKNLSNYYIISKQYLFTGLVLASLLLYILKIVFTKKITYNYSILDIPLAIASVLVLFSTVFSANRYISFLGKTEYFIFSLVFFLSLVIFYLLITNVAENKKRWSILLNGIIYVGGVISFVSVLSLIFKINILSYLGFDTINMIDPKVSGFAIWNLMIFLLSLGKLLKKEENIFKKTIFILFAIFSFIVIMVLNLKMIWWFMFLGLTLLIVSGVLFTKNIKVGNMTVLFLFLVFNVVFLVFGTPSFLQAGTPMEMSLNYKPSFDITFSSCFSSIKNFALGGGPGTFDILFSKFRSIDFNYDSTAWYLRFGQPNNSVLGLVSEFGILFFVVFLYVIVYVFGFILNVSYSNIKESKSTIKELLDNFTNEIQDFIDLLIVSVVWFTLTVIMFFTFLDTVLWWLWFLLLGLIIVGLSFSNSKIISKKVLTIENTPEKSLAFSFISIVILVFVVLASVLGIKLYRAEFFYAKAISAQDFETVANNLSKAVNYRKTENKYYVAAAKAYLNRAVELSQKTESNAQEISVLVAQAVNYAKLATDLAPNSVGLWENLASMYGNASLFLNEAKDWEKISYEKCIELEPTNPSFFYFIGNYYLNKENNDEAIKNYEKAIELKNDYYTAYIGLASVYEKQGDYDKSLATYERIISNANQEYEFLYNYARVLYNRNKGDDRDYAEKIWQYVIQLNSKYSNAYYSLGLLYEGKNDKNSALENYYKLKELLPDNQIVIDKIKSLTAGNSENTK
ncbi:MAG: tetratricopeptide repeat protein [Patescibacteria group bacterium]